MNAGLPKQYLELHGQTMLQRSIQALNNDPAIDGIVVVLSPDDERFKTLPATPGPWCMMPRGRY